MSSLEKLPMRRLSRETAAVLKTLKKARRSMIVTHFGEPVALLTPVTNEWGSSVPSEQSPEPMEQRPTAEDGRGVDGQDLLTGPEREIVRLVQSGVSSPTDLATASGMDLSESLILLARCEMKRAVVKKPWGYFPR